MKDKDNYIEKSKLIPEFFKVRGLVQQHIQSYNNFINFETKKIIKNNSKIYSSVDTKVCIEISDLKIEKPIRKGEDNTTDLTPQECRLRSMTYAAPITVSIRQYNPRQRHDDDNIKNIAPPNNNNKRRRSNSIVKTVSDEVYDLSKGARVAIGQIPIMLHSDACVLKDKTEKQLAKAKECFMDPGGYFIIKGTEKVILIQEQLSKNRIICDIDSKSNVYAYVVSSTETRKTRTSIIQEDGRLFVKANSLNKLMPIIVLFKAMGLTSEKEFATLVGINEKNKDIIVECIKDAHYLNITTQEQALDYIGEFIGFSGARATGIKKQKDALKKSSYDHKVMELKHVATDDNELISKINDKFIDLNKNNELKKQIDFNNNSGKATYPFKFNNYNVDEKNYYYSTRSDEARDFLCTVFLSHVEVNNYNFTDKILYLAYMIRKLLSAQLDHSKLDDKDYYGNKRLELAGELLALLFDDLYKRFIADLRKQMDNVLKSKNRTSNFNVLKHIREDTITYGFSQALATGNWSVKRFRMERAGITQQLTRLSYMSAIGHMTRISSQFEKSRKVSGPRALQSSQWGMLCPSDTPEGESCGLIKNLSLLTHISTDFSFSRLKELCLYHFGVLPISFVSYTTHLHKNTFLVLVDGIIIGVHFNPKKFTKLFRKFRRTGAIGEFVSIFTDEKNNTISIAGDAGRVCRPLIIVENGKPLINQYTLFHSYKRKHYKSIHERKKLLTFLIRNGLVEYIDVNESNNTIVALKEGDITKNSTHLEIDPLTILGVVAGLIPYPHHNQSPRNTYQCAMGKQAIGTIGFNQLNRIETVLYLMVYPQKPLVTSTTLELIKFEQVPAGQNAVIAVMSYSGYDIEDALILNKASVDRGFGRCTVYRKYFVRRNQYPNGTADKISGYKSNINEQFIPKNEKSIEEDGIVGVGVSVDKNDVLVRRLVPKDTQNDIAELTSDDDYNKEFLRFKGPSIVTVDKVMRTSTQVTGEYLIKILTRDVRRPVLGDKFSSRHGQKGVCGLIVPHDDLPFNNDGLVPDIIMNPHGFPSRMTVGKTIELLAGKAGVHDGEKKYGTAFAGNSIESCCKVLVENGYSYNGRDSLISGITGEPLTAYVFMGPIYYQKLKHMVADKIHARSRGPRAVLSRQPTEGRSKDGGLRVGEMERDCLISYGTGGLLLERLMVSSDSFIATICNNCGCITRPTFCKACKSAEYLKEMEIPYACKLLFQELTAMNIRSKITLVDR